VEFTNDFDRKRSTRYFTETDESIVQDIYKNLSTQCQCTLKVKNEVFVVEVSEMNRWLTRLNMWCSCR
jgi:hypothetical protein